MAYVQLDQASREVGKSEVTLRRLVKAGKISHKKEKTLTGFIYLVDPQEVLEYYGSGQASEGGGEGGEESEGDTEQKTQPPIRLAVTGESGSLSEYWQKRADMFEQRYHQEISKQNQLREELGIWRGRAEQAQNMLLKLLPASTEPAQSEKTSPANNENWPLWLSVLTVTLLTAVLGVGILAVYLLAS